MFHMAKSSQTHARLEPIELSMSVSEAWYLPFGSNEELT